MPAKRKGQEVRESTSIRLEPKEKEKIRKVFGSVQSWVDHCLEILNKTKDKK